MTRYVLLLVGGALVVSALSLLGDRSSVNPPYTDVSNVVLNASDPGGVFVPNLGNAPVDAFFYMVADQSVVLLKSKAIEVVRPGSDRTELNLYFIGASGAPRVTGITSGQGSGFQRVRYSGLYEGVDLLLAGQDDGLTATMTLSPGVDAGIVHFKLERENASTPLPSAYQMINGVRESVEARFIDGLFGSTKLELGEVVSGVPVNVGFGVSL